MSDLVSAAGSSTGVEGDQGRGAHRVIRSAPQPLILVASSSPESLGCACRVRSAADTVRYQPRATMPPPCVGFDRGCCGGAMQIGSKTKRQFWTRALLGSVPDIILALIVRPMDLWGFSRRSLAFSFSILCFGVKSTLWMWVIFWFDGRKWMAGQIDAGKPLSGTGHLYFGRRRLFRLHRRQSVAPMRIADQSSDRACGSYFPVSLAWTCA